MFSSCVHVLISSKNFALILPKSSTTDTLETVEEALPGIPVKNVNDFLMTKIYYKFPAQQHHAVNCSVLKVFIAGLSSIVAQYRT